MDKRLNVIKDVMENASVLDSIKHMIRLLENSLKDAKKLVHKSNKTAGIRVRRLMQEIKFIHVKNVRDKIQLIDTSKKKYDE